MRIACGNVLLKARNLCGSLVKDMEFHSEADGIQTPFSCIILQVLRNRLKSRVATFKLMGGQETLILRPINLTSHSFAAP